MAFQSRSAEVQNFDRYVAQLHAKTCDMGIPDLRGSLDIRIPGTYLTNVAGMADDADILSAYAQILRLITDHSAHHNSFVQKLLPASFMYMTLGEDGMNILPSEDRRGPDIDFHKNSRTVILFEGQSTTQPEFALFLVNKSTHTVQIYNPLGENIELDMAMYFLESFLKATTGIAEWVIAEASEPQFKVSKDVRKSPQEARYHFFLLFLAAFRFVLGYDAPVPVKLIFTETRARKVFCEQFAEVLTQCIHCKSILPFRSPEILSTGAVPLKVIASGEEVAQIHLLYAYMPQTWHEDRIIDTDNPFEYFAVIFAGIFGPLINMQEPVGDLQIVNPLKEFDFMFVLIALLQPDMRDITSCPKYERNIDATTIKELSVKEATRFVRNGFGLAEHCKETNFPHLFHVTCRVLAFSLRYISQDKLKSLYASRNVPVKDLPFPTFS
jgi:hypothetical protein